MDANLRKEWEDATPLQSEWDQAAPIKPQSKPFTPEVEIIDGVPKWGRDHPNLYAGVETLLDLAPMAASAAKTTGIGIPVAGAINAGAKALQRNIAGEGTTAGDVGLDFLKGATVEGGGRALGAVVKGITDLPGVQSTLNGAANRIIRTAGKFGTGGGLTPSEQKAMADTVLKKGYLFNEGSHVNLLDRVKSNSKAVDDIYAAGTAAGDTFLADDVLAKGGFSDLMKRGESVRGVSPNYLSRVSKVMNNFKAGERVVNPEEQYLSPLEAAMLNKRPDFVPEKPYVSAPYTPTDLNVSKRQIYQDLGDAYNNRKVNNADEVGKKTLASAIKKTLDEKYPSAVPFNEDSSALLDLEPYFARAINRISQRDAVGLGEKIALGSLKDPISLSEMSPGKLAKLVAAVWDRPEIKSKVARMIYSQKPKPGSKAIKAAGKVVAPSLRAALEGAMYTEDPLGIR